VVSHCPCPLHPYLPLKGSLVDPLMRATFSPAQPRSRRDALLSQASTFLSCAFREQEDDQAARPPS